MGTFAESPNTMPESHAQFGAECVRILTSKPFGTLGKRELELALLQAAIDADLLPNEPVQLAARLQLSLSRANAYLTDLALRRPPLSDTEAIARLVALLPGCEVVPSDKHLSLPLHDTSLRIWLERKLASNRLHPGETLRWDVVKLTPAGLLRLLDHSTGTTTPAEALARMAPLLDGPAWIAEAQATWKPRTSWRDTLSTFDSTLSIVQALPHLLSAALGG